MTLPRNAKVLQTIGMMVGRLTQVPNVDDLAQFIRTVDGNNPMGAGTLAEKICEWLESLPPAPVANLLPVPEPDVIAYTAIGDNDAYSPRALTKYGEAVYQQGRMAGLEQSAKLADSVGHHWSGAPALAFFDLATRIRGLVTYNISYSSFTAYEFSAFENGAKQRYYLANAVDVAISEAMVKEQAQPVPSTGKLLGNDMTELKQALRFALDYIDGFPKEVISSAAGFDRDWAESLCAVTPAIAEATPDIVAYVPIHPRNGPLWASTIATLDADHPASYEMRPVYFAPPELEKPEVTARIYKRDSTQEWVLELSGVIDDTAFICRHTQPLHVARSEVAGLPTMYDDHSNVVALSDEQVDVLLADFSKSEASQSEPVRMTYAQGRKFAQLIYEELTGARMTATCPDCHGTGVYEDAHQSFPCQHDCHASTQEDSLNQGASAPAMCSDGGKCGVGGYCSECPAQKS